MRKLKFIINNILSNPILYIFILIELTISVYYVNELLMTLEFKNRAYEIVDKSTSKEEVLALNIYPEYFAGEDESLELIISEILDYTGKQEEVSFKGKLMVGDTGPLELKVSYNKNIKEPYFYRGELENNTAPEDGEYNSIKYFSMDYDYYKSFPLEIEEGTPFTREMEDWNKETYPIILGHNFKEYYELGEIIDDEAYELKYEIVGFAKEGEIVKYGMDYENVNNCLDDSFITLMTKNFKEENTLKHLSYNNALVFGVKEGQDSGGLTKRVIEYAKGKDLKISFASWEKTENYFKESINRSVNIAVIKSSTIAILSIFGLIGTLIYCIKNMMRNIGVLTVVGAKRRSILGIIYGQVAILYGISYVIGFYLSSQIKAVTLYFIPTFDLFIIIKGFLVVLLCLILAVTIPTIYLLKQKPINLVGVFRE